MRAGWEQVSVVALRPGCARQLIARQRRPPSALSPPSMLGLQWRWCQAQSQPDWRRRGLPWWSSALLPWLVPVPGPVLAQGLARLPVAAVVQAVVQALVRASVPAQAPV